MMKSEDEMSAEQMKNYSADFDIRKAEEEKESLKKNGWVCPDDELIEEYHEKTAWEEEQSDIEEQMDEQRRYEREYGHEVDYYGN